MKKRILFCAFSMFVLLFTMAAWSYASDELASLQDQKEARDPDGNNKNGLVWHKED